MTADCHAIVIGAGPAGLAAALALAEIGAGVVLAGPPARADDSRTAALFGGSIALVRRLGAIDACAAGSAAITGIRLIDDTGGLLRAPEVLFAARDAGLDVFGLNVPNRVLTAALEAAVARQQRLRRVPTRAVTAIEIGADRVTVRLAEGQSLSAPLLVGADGRSSPARQAAGIATRAWDTPQAAVVASFGHGRPHRGISTELHRRAGPLTVVPLPDRVDVSPVAEPAPPAPPPPPAPPRAGEGSCRPVSASSLVWVETRAEAARLAALDDAAFRAELELRLNGLLGGIGDLTPRATFPLAGLTAERMAARRVALVGEAGHVMPPIGAQGLNLGLRDAAALADCVADALAVGRDPGGPETLAAYQDARAADVAARVAGVDLLNRSLLAGLLPVDLLRGAGLHVMAALAPLRQALIRVGMEPPGALPRLMRPQGA